MAANTKRVFFVNYVPAPILLELLARRPDIQVDRLSNDSPEAEAEPILSRAHAYQIPATRHELAPRFHGTAALLARTPNLLVVSSSGAGYDTVDVAACTAAGVIVVNQAGGNREAVAEHVLGMMLTLSKRLIQADRSMRREAGIKRSDYTGNDVFGRTVGIVGIGHVGSRLAEVCTGLFRMCVLAYDPYLTAGQIAARSAEKVETLDDLLRQSDFVSINCPLTAETHGMIGAREFALMRPHVFFITTARGGIHDEAALAEALQDKRIAGAGLDVWETESPDPAHPLLQFDNVLSSPHTAGVTRESRDTMARMTAEQLIDILDGKRPPRLINPEAWPAYCDRFERIIGVRPQG